MAAKPARLVGSREIKRLNPAWDFGEKITCTVRFVGPYKALLAARPRKGDTLNGLSNYGLRVVSARVEPGESVDGTMTVTLEADQAQSSDQNGPEQIGEPVHELEWGELQRKIEEHPMWKEGGSYPIRDAGWDKIEEWKKADTAADRAAIRKELAENKDDKFGKDAYRLLDKLKRGQEDYVVCYPIARRTTKMARTPGNLGAGMYGVGTPPPECAAPQKWGSGAKQIWRYFKSADRYTREGRDRTRTEEWTGAQELDPDVFGPGAA
jgi:hypothetical protein